MRLMARAAALRDGRVDSYDLTPQRVHDALGVIESETALLMAEQQQRAERKQRARALHR